MPPFLSFLYQRVRVQNAKTIRTTVEMTSGILKKKKQRLGHDDVARSLGDFEAEPRS